MKRRAYTKEHAVSGVTENLPEIEVFENAWERNYTITIVIPEYTSICPRTHLPDFGTLTVEYVPDKLCMELKSLKYYILAYRNMGIFYENAVNRILDDIVKFCKPRFAKVKGEFNTRGGMHSMIEVTYPPRQL